MSCEYCKDGQTLVKPTQRINDVDVSVVVYGNTICLKQNAIVSGDYISIDSWSPPIKYCPMCGEKFKLWE